jgi:hypothetical protein
LQRYSVVNGREMDDRVGVQREAEPTKNWGSST